MRLLKFCASAEFRPSRAGEGEPSGLRCPRCCSRLDGAQRPAGAPSASASSCRRSRGLRERAALADEASPATDNALATLCGIVEAAARQEGLPVNFFTRLIWRESAFQSGAVSPAGAQGVAQFMPGTAAERGLADPFDPAAAIPASAKLLAELGSTLRQPWPGGGRLQRRAERARRLDRRPRLPAARDAGLRARDHRPRCRRVARRKPAVARRARPGQALPGLDRKSAHRARAGASPIVSGLFAPWGVQISASFDKGSALRAFARAQHDYYRVIGNVTPFVLGSVLRSRGWRPFYRVRLPAQTGAEAKKLCDRLQAAGAACAVLRS